MFETPRVKYPLLILLLAVLATVIGRSAWMCDDAYIGFRVVDNWVNGYGLTWNVGERVQVFTNPLWIFLVSGLFVATGELYDTVIACSIALSVLAVGVVAFRARSTASAVLVVAVAVSSKAFVDFAASGLENPLGYVLIALFFVSLPDEPPTPKRLFLLSLLTSLAALNRLDALVLLVPAWLWVGRSACTRQSAGMVALGLLPLVIWEVFSFVYFGSLVPNTAYAKLNTGIGRVSAMGRGLHYLVNSVTHDPVTLGFVGVALAQALATGDRRARAVAGGIVLNLAYVVWIGGDFMSGRFLTPCLVAALVLVSELPQSGFLGRVYVGALLVLNLVTPHATLLGDSRYGSAGRETIMDYYGVSDERACYYPWTGLLNASPDMSRPFHPWAEYGERLRARGKSVVVEDNLGFTGYFAGPHVYIINHHALSDPFLARLPAPTDGGWRVGHQRRPIPEGYVETKSTGRNHLTDPALARAYDRMQFIIAGPLWDARRLRECASLVAGFPR